MVLPWSWALTLVLALVLSLVLGLAEVLASGLLSSEPGVSCAPVVPDSGLNQQGAASETSQPNVDTDIQRISFRPQADCHFGS